ncbi:hypothetical protein PM082_019374 [Marasmius tenuissimus]|nr:hypothetical protein PM082_019268 [Marasmius tenuissimus]KAJ8075047.1 hypothetical protein PM082_019374 [Marasmius tenuissimus]
MLRLVLSDTLCAQYQLLLTHTQQSLDSQGLQERFRVITDETWLKDIKTVRWEGVGGKVALLWLDSTELQSLTARRGLLDLVEEFRQVHRQIDRSQQTWLLLYGYADGIEDSALDLIQAQFMAGVRVVTAASENIAIFKLVSISKGMASASSDLFQLVLKYCIAVLNECLVDFSRFYAPSRTVFRVALQSKIGLDDAIADLVAIRYKSWEGLCEGVDQLETTEGPAYRQLLTTLLKDHREANPRTEWLTESDMKEPVRRLFEYVTQPSVVWE